MVFDITGERDLRRLVLELEDRLPLEFLLELHAAADLAGDRRWCQWAASTFDRLHALKGCCL